jgi:hypothetical protein
MGNIYVFRVTLIHSHQEVLAMMSDKFRLLAQAHLEKIGVEIILSDKVINYENGRVRKNDTAVCILRNIFDGFVLGHNGIWKDHTLRFLSAMFSDWWQCRIFLKDWKYRPT